MEIFRAGKTIEKSAWSPLGLKIFLAGKKKSAWSPFLARRISFSFPQGPRFLPAGSHSLALSCKDFLLLPTGPMFLARKVPFLFRRTKQNLSCKWHTTKKNFFWKSCGQDKKFRPDPLNGFGSRSGLAHV